MSDYVTVNGGRLEFDIGVTQTVDGFVGRVYMQQVEVYATPPVPLAGTAAQVARAHVVRVFAR